MSEESGRDTSVLITGGCGYIGSALIPRLLADERVGDVVVLDSLSSGSPANLAGSIRDDLTFRRGDVREYGAVEGSGSRRRRRDPSRGDHRGGLDARPEGPRRSR